MSRAGQRAGNQLSRELQANAGAISAALGPALPTHVVVDDIDGYVYSSLCDGSKMSAATAADFAATRNAERKPEAPKLHVYELVPDESGIRPHGHTEDGPPGCRRCQLLREWVTRT